MTGGRPGVVASRVGGLGIDPVEVDRLGYHGGVDISDLGQSGEDRHHHMAGVDFEEPAEGRPGVAPAEPVSSQRSEGAAHPTAHLVGNHGHVVGDGDHRPITVGQQGGD